MNKSQLSSKIKQLAFEQGFHLAGISPAVKLPRSEYLKEWLAQGMHGRMSWMENYLKKRLDIKKLFPSAVSVISVGHNYYAEQEHPESKDAGKISRYAWGRDYHKIIKKKLKLLLQEIIKIESSADGRIFVDTAPVQDKLWAQNAGIGWQGKNANIISRDLGSWLFLGELALNIDLDCDQPAKNYCGNCSACIDACPTQALSEYKLDSRRCISYLTIEHRDSQIPAELSKKMQNWIFGCDICQQVCPWNKFAKETDENAYFPASGNTAPKLLELSRMSEQEFKKCFKESPVYRSRFQNFMRNVNTVLNSSDR